MSQFNVYGKRGRGWELLYSGLRAETPRGAALMAGYMASRRYLKVEKPGGGSHVFKFGFTPELHHGS